MNKLKNIIILFLVVISMSCNTSISDFSSYMKYLSNENNGLVKEKASSGILIKVKYLPTDYLIYNELKNEKEVSQQKRDSLEMIYSNSITFMMTIGPDKGESFDITKVGVKDYQEFAQRVEEMNFNMGEYVTLKIKDTEYKPELTQMESISGLEKDRNIIFVFTALNKQGKKILDSDAQFIYNDDLFYTGINKFKFKIEDINKLPEFKF